MRSSACLILIVTYLGSIGYAQPATRAEREKALRERPLLFGVSVDWYPESYPTLPEVYWGTLGDRLRDLGATATLVEFDWSEIETAPGEFDFVRPDAEVERANKLGLEIVGRILGSPAWANPAGRPSSRHFPRESAASDFGLFCERLATRYRGRVNRYEFPSTPGRPEPEQYVRWFGACRASLKQGNPKSVLALGGPGPDGAGFLESVYALGGRGVFDAVSVGVGLASSSMAMGSVLDEEGIEKIRAAMVANGDGDRPVWATGYSCPVDVYGIHDQSAYVTAALDFMVKREWISLGILESLADPPGATGGLTGLCDGDLVPRPAYGAFARYVNAPAGLQHEEPDPWRFASPKGKQLAANPGFEERSGTGFASWISWGDGTTAAEGATSDQYEGNRAAPMVAEGRAFRGGLYQFLEVPEGIRLAATVRTKVSFTKVPPKARIGIDLLGGTDPNADSITWSPWHSSHDPDAGWVEIGLEYPVRVDGDRATVILEWSQPVAAGRCVVGFDEVRVGAAGR